MLALSIDDPVESMFEFCEYVKKNDLETVSLALESGGFAAVLDAARDCDGGDPMREAQSFEMASLLVKHGFRLEPSDLQSAAGDGRLGVCKALLEAGMDVDGGFTDTLTTPLSEAARCNHYECVLLLLAQGANVNIFTDKRGPCMLDYAIKGEYGASNEEMHTRFLIAEALLRAGADTGIVTNDEGASILHFCAHFDAFEIAKLLVEEYGMAANLEDDEGSPPINYLSRGGRYEEFKQFLETAAAEN